MFFGAYKARIRDLEERLAVVMHDRDHYRSAWLDASVDGMMAVQELKDHREWCAAGHREPQLPVEPLDVPAAEEALPF